MHVCVCVTEMRLEVVDKRNPVLVRAATVAEVDGFRLKVQ